MDSLRNNGHSAIIWCTDGGDYNYWRYSLASMRMMVKRPTDYFVITLPTDNLHGMDIIFGLRRIDPTPYMEQLGFTKDGYDKLGNRWPVAILYKLCVPLIGELKQYSSVMTLDTDVMAMPTPKSCTVDELLEHPLGEFEVGGVPDLYEPLDRVHTLIRRAVPDDIRNELKERVWDKYGSGCQSYISAGLFLWNIPVIDRDIDWYIRRCKAFWPRLLSNSYIFPEQDFVNAYMGVDCRLQSCYGARADGNGPYVTCDSTMRHFTGIGKFLMHNMAKKIPEINPRARISQACIRPRPTDIDPYGGKPSPKRCIVWSSTADDDDVKKLGYAVDSLHDACGDALKGIDMFVITDGPWLAQKFKRNDVQVVNIDGLYDLSGFRAMCNWRSGHLSWERTDLARLFIPFMPELKDYDLTLFIEGDMMVVDKRMLDIFREDVRGYDYAMCPEFKVGYGIFEKHPSIRFCTAWLQALRDIRDSDAVFNRLNSGVYFSTSVFLANMRELRKTLGSLQRMCQIGVHCIGNGGPATEKELPNGVCIIKPVSGSYNTAGSTHFPGEPTYCVHNYSLAKEGEKYPVPYTNYL